MKKNHDPFHFTVLMRKRLSYFKSDKIVCVFFKLLEVVLPNRMDNLKAVLSMTKTFSIDKTLMLL